MRHLFVHLARNMVTAWQGHLGKSRFDFVSTDIVFSGKHPPYKESDRPDPAMPYGEVKSQAERDVLDAMGVVVRTSLVYGLRPPDPRTVVSRKGLESGKFAYPYSIADTTRKRYPKLP